MKGKDIFTKIILGGFLIKIIVNQHEIDKHIQMSKNCYVRDEYLLKNNGIVNKSISRITNFFNA